METLKLLVALGILASGLTTKPAAGLKCYTCREVDDLKDCTHSSECAVDEACFARSILTVDGRRAYRLGCESKDVCDFFNKGIHLLGRREENDSNDHCRQCCYDDDCNNILCSKKSNDTSKNRADYCYYKHKLYAQGETWIDGCDYNCTCVNGSYRCMDLCPTYNHVPQCCTLSHRPGICCMQVFCSTTCTPGYCYYKEQTYAQGETWKDGCDYKCTCNNATTGLYKCQTLCLQWNLPPVCTMVSPVPGKCCDIPSCPPGITIQYPPGYTPE